MGFPLVPAKALQPGGRRAVAPLQRSLLPHAKRMLRECWEPSPLGSRGNEEFRPYISVANMVAWLLAQKQKCLLAGPTGFGFETPIHVIGVLLLAKPNQTQGALGEPEVSQNTLPPSLKEQCSFDPPSSARACWSSHAGASPHKIDWVATRRV